MEDQYRDAEHTMAVLSAAAHPGCETCLLSHRSSCDRTLATTKHNERAVGVPERHLPPSYPIWAVRLLPLLILALLLTGCDTPTTAPLAVTKPSRRLAQQQEQEAALPRGDRMLGIDLTLPETADFDQAMALARGAGAEVLSLSVFWDDIEVSPGVYRPDPNWLAIANAYYPHQNVKTSLMVGPIDTNRLRVPSDLVELPFDDPRVIGRYLGLLDYVFSQIPDLTLSSFSVGNEVDIFLGNDTTRWQAYQEFYGAVRDHVHEARPGVPVGVKTTFEGMMNGRSGLIQDLNRPSDVVLTTYYPLEPDFTVRPPATVHSDLGAIAAQFAGMPIYLLEAGYPSSTVNGSSETRQAEFIREMFAAWDKHPDQIMLISFTWLTDLPDTSVEDLKFYYGLEDRGFAEFLRSLGLRTFPGDGNDKLGWSTLVIEAGRRGW